MKRIFPIIAYVLFSLLCAAQSNETTLEDFIAEVNQRCPIAYGDGWTVESFTGNNDTMTVSIALEGEVANYLPMMAVNAEQVKKMWLGRMSHYGGQWNRLVELVVAEGKTLDVALHGQDNSAMFIFTFSPNELKTNLP